jgi:hypothetical protein
VGHQLGDERHFLSRIHAIGSARETHEKTRKKQIMRETKPRFIHLKMMASPKRRNAVSPLIFVSFVCFVGILLNRYV